MEGCLDLEGCGYGLGLQ